MTPKVPNNLKNSRVAQVYVNNATLFLEGSDRATLQSKGGGRFVGPISANVVSATVGISSSVLPDMEASLPLGHNDTQQIVAEQTLTIKRVFSGRVRLPHSFPYH